jgi:RNA 2',3'-cyclic 3'-phosphodiesterase
MSNSPAVTVRRLFFALWPDDTSRLHLATAVGNLATACAGRPVPVQNLHVTLAYLGAVPESRIAEIMSVAQRVADEFLVDSEPLLIKLDRVEHWRQPQILCATACGPPLQATISFDGLSERLKREAVSAKFTPDLQPARAHVTVARKIRHTDDIPDIEPVLWTFTEFTLLDSRNSSSDPQYSVMEKWRFASVPRDIS